VKKEGKLVIFSAPSGAGKTTIVQHLIKCFPHIEFSVSATSRPPRGDEQHGVDYYFLSEEEFRRRIDEGEFVEWEEVYPGQFYGTLQSEVERIWRKGNQVIFDVDVMGGLNLKKRFRDKALAVFVQPPSVKALEERLRFRATEPEEKIRMRLRKAELELAYAPKFDKIILNENLDAACNEACFLIQDFLA
jgi:guanylate kinase